jgi:tetratricopeptide (TPR) repeat protein
MRAISAAALVVGLCLFPTPARAGIYHPEEPDLGGAANFQQFRMRLGKIQRIAQESGPSDPAPRMAYLAQVENIRAKEKQGPLSIVDRCNLGSCYIRLNRPTDAIAVLKPVEQSPNDPNQFLALSTLATAYQHNGDLDTAENYLQQALRVWLLRLTPTGRWDN